MVKIYLAAVAAFVALGGVSTAADFSDASNGLRGGYQTEFGTRAWLGFGTTAKDLYNPGGGSVVSRLSYNSVPTTAGELFGKVTTDQFFVSGYAGLGSMQGGQLRDEDFPPATSPYSSTQSGQHNGSLNYATIDLGRNLYTSATGKLGAFVGYNYLNQQVNAFGCTQTGDNSGICVPTIADSTEVVSQNNTWQSLRLGLSGDMELGDRWTFSGDAAFLPYVHMSGSDTHWLRIPSSFTGPVPEDGDGWGVQMQAMADYRINNTFSVGVGGRYWHMQTAGTAHFEDHLTGGGGVPQPVDWRTDMMGLLAEAKANF